MAEVNKISSFKSFSEIKAQENDMKLREENNLKKQETLSKIEEILDEMGLTNLSEIDEDSQKTFISKLLGREMNEGNAFVFAAGKAKAEGKSEFEFNGKMHKVTIKDTGVKESLVNEGAHGMATKLLKSIVNGESSKAEGIKMSKELAQHYIDWIRTSPYGKKNGNLPLNMLIDASFNWGIERGTDAKLKAEIKDLKSSVKESFLLTEGTRGQFGKIDKQGKIQSVYTHYDSYPENMLPIIKKHYKNAKAVNSVIAKGDMSGLDAFDNINFYGATSNPSIGSAEKINDFVKFTKENGGAEFVYLFDERDKKWYMIDIYGGSKLVPAFESFVVEGAVKQFDADFNDMVKNIKSGYGWIDPEFVADTWENSSDSIDFELVKGEIYSRLIKAGLLWYSDEDGEEKGKQVKSLKELGIKESLVTENSKINNVTITSDLFTADNNWWVKNKLRVSDDISKALAGCKTKHVVIDIDKIHESVVNESEIKSDDEFKEYAFSVLKKAFGADFDEAKAGEVVDGILGKADGDYGTAVGMLTGSLGESVVTEREETQIGTHRYQGKSYPLYTDDEHNHYIKVNGRIIAVDESVTNEAIDVKYWEDYHEKSTKITSASKVARAVEDEVEDWNDNNENGSENEVTSAGEKKVMNLAHDFFKAAGWISSDIIQAMIVQES